MEFRFESNLDDILGKIKEAEERALEMVGLFVEGEAKIRCAVDTGNLRSSIDHKVDNTEKSVTIGTNVEYAIYVKKGTRYQRSQPYLTPAIEQNQNNIKRIFEEELITIDWFIDNYIQ